MRMSYVILSWQENVRGNRTELVTCVKVALKHDWQLFCLQLNHLYPSSTNTFTGYSGGVLVLWNEMPPFPSSGDTNGTSAFSMLLWLAAASSLLPLSYPPFVIQLPSHALAAVGNKHLVTSRSMMLCLSEACTHTHLAPRRYASTFPSLRLSDHISIQYPPCCSTLPYCLTVWSLLPFRIAQNPARAGFAVRSEK